MSKRHDAAWEVARNSRDIGMVRLELVVALKENERLRQQIEGDTDRRVRLKRRLYALAAENHLISTTLAVLALDGSLRSDIRQLQEKLVEREDV